MSNVIDMFSRRVIEEQIIYKPDELDHIFKLSPEGCLEEAASKVFAAAAKLAIECELDTFDSYLGDLIIVIRQYQVLKK